MIVLDHFESQAPCNSLYSQVMKNNAAMDYDPGKVGLEQLDTPSRGTATTCAQPFTPAMTTLRSMSSWPW